MNFFKKASETEKMISSLKDNKNVYLVPAFTGLGAPYWDERARGAILGITRGTTREQIVRATLESIAYQTRDVVECVRVDSGLQLDALRVDGGAAEQAGAAGHVQPVPAPPSQRIAQHTGQPRPLWYWA